ncbi:MAG TPA: multiheme c-type cytochrome, partial [Lacipirellulaceae bacterium]|nr:multiheme c-type cytochrome [Lacipirellulaceae bacterium]
MPHPATAGQGASGARSATNLEPVSLQVQQMLAQGGCPGWIALASDPALQAALDSPAVRPAAYQTPPLPGSRPGAGHLFPAPPPPVAARPPEAADAGVRLVQLPPVEDDDELIPESEDLLRSSPEIAGTEATPAADAPVPPDATSASESAPASPAPPGPGPELPTAEQLLGAADDLVAPKTSVDPAAAAPPEPQPAESQPADPQPAEPEPAEPEPLPPLPAGDAAADAAELLDDRGDLLVPPTSAPPVALPPPPGSAAPPQLPAIPPTTPTIPAAPATPAAPTPTGAAPSAPASASPSPAGGAADAARRCEFVAKSLYPSAAECRNCHEKVYDEWSMSSHAYAFVSPMFHKFERKINDVASGTIGYFCYRCHTPVGTSLGLSRAAPLWDAPQAAREGVTCVACHRVREMYGKSNGERRIEPGDIFAPVYGTIGGGGVAAAAARKTEFKVHTSPHDQGPGMDMHAAGECMPQLGRSEFCTSCHQVAVYPGIKLEVVWEQYRASPACKKGVQCQDCHMGRIPGVASGYESGPAAVIAGKSVEGGRKHSNHVFYGPGYSIAHPGVFPFNPKAERWNVRDWLLFDWRAGWGTDAFEEALDDGKIHATFPDVWKEADDRYDAREIIDDNLKKKAIKNTLRELVMENGSHVEGPYFDAAPRAGQELRFSYVVVNTNDGHNLPTASLGAQPQLWANVVLMGPRGERLWESGYLDSNGDLADIHSVDVRNKRLPFDWQLFNLQTMFLITGAKGTDREFYLPVNVDIDPLPFIRPAGQPVSVINHPPFIRMEARSLAPLGSRRVP